MAKAYPETITLKGLPIFKEGKAVASIAPGHLVEFGTTVADIQKQSSSGSKHVRKAFALENDLIGKTINDAYVANENVRYGTFYAGQEVLAKVTASADAIIVGDPLEAAGNGALRKWTTLNDGTVVGYALEAIDNSANASSQVFIKMEVA